MINIANLVKRINRITILTSQAAGPAIDWLHLHYVHAGRVYSMCSACVSAKMFPTMNYLSLAACTTLRHADMKHHPNKVWSHPVSVGLEPYMSHCRKSDGVE